jgi:serine/threonine-protein kinase
MGTVYRARDPLIDRLVAIKTIDFSEAGDPAQRQQLRDRVIREASAAGALSHPNIVTVHDAGELGSKAYIVMEYVEGVTLWQARESGEPPERGKVLDILRQTAAALDYAHERGIVHRDVKPGNIMIDRRGAVKIADFGIARMIAGERLTRTGMIVGTPHYMAPEQLGAGEAGPAADQFALAINAYETLTGNKPFDADNFSALLAKILNEDPPPMRAADSLIPAAAEAAIKRALAKDPRKRYPSCSAFAAALNQAFAAASPAAGPSGSGATAPKGGASRLKWAALAASVVVVALAGWLALAPPEPAPRLEQALPPFGAGEVPVSAQQPETQAGAGAAGQSLAPAQSLTPAATKPGPTQTSPAAGGQPISNAPPASERVVSNEPNPERASEPAAPPKSGEPPPAPAAGALVASGPTITAVWRGNLQTGETLTIDKGVADKGKLSRALPSIPIEIEVAPANSVEILEAPSQANGWSQLRLRNLDRPRTLIFIRYRELGPR